MEETLQKIEHCIDTVMPIANELKAAIVTNQVSGVDLATTKPITYSVFLTQNVQDFMGMQPLTDTIKAAKAHTNDVEYKFRLLSILAATLKYCFYFKIREFAIQPHIFAIPDPSLAMFPYLGIIIKNKRKNSSLILCEENVLARVIESKTSIREIDTHFNTVIGTNIDNWFSTKKWAELRGDFDIETFYRTSSRELAKQIEHIRKIEDFPFGKVVKLDYEQNHDAQMAGALRFGKMKNWFIPFGIDEQDFFEYLEFYNY